MGLYYRKEYTEKQKNLLHGFRKWMGNKEKQYTIGAYKKAKQEEVESEDDEEIPYFIEKALGPADDDFL